MDVKIEPSWKVQLQEEFGKPYFAELTQFVRQEYRRTRSTPSPSSISRTSKASP